MEEESLKEEKENQENPKNQDSPHCKPSSDVEGIRFGTQFIFKSFTVRRSSPLDLLRLLSVRRLFPSTTTFIPTNFTILAHHMWHTLTLGLGTKKSKAILFVFESETMKEVVERLWPAVVPFGDVNKKLILRLAHRLRDGEMSATQRQGCPRDWQRLRHRP